MAPNEALKKHSHCWFESLKNIAFQNLHYHTERIQFGGVVKLNKIKSRKKVQNEDHEGKLVKQLSMNYTSKHIYAHYFGE